MMLLRYLVTGRARRELLCQLWAKHAEGSVSALARSAGVSFSLAHRELEAMLAAGLALRERAEGRLVYRANARHPLAAVVRRLVREPSVTPGQGSDKVRGWLASAGAPLLVSKAPSGRTPRLEVLLAEGLTLAHRDATVARVLPVLIWRHREHVDFGRLVCEATRLDERHTLGFFLELTGLLGGDARLVDKAVSLRDKRRTRVRLFFARPHGRHALASARQNTPRLAREWGFLMDMTLDTFASAFAKHAEVA